MRELRATNGLAAKDLLDRINGRQVVVWGGNGSCVEVVAALQGFYKVTEGVVITMHRIGFDEFTGYLVSSPSEWLSTNALNPASHFIIVASVGYRQQIVDQLHLTNFRRKSDYVLAHEVFRKKVVIRLRNGEQIAVESLLAYFAKNKEHLNGCTVEVVGLPNPLACDGLEALIFGLRKFVPVTLTSYVPAIQLVSIASENKLRLRLIATKSPATYGAFFPGHKSAELHSYNQLIDALVGIVPLELVGVGFRPDSEHGFPDKSGVITIFEHVYPIDFADLLECAEAADTKRLAELQSFCDIDLLDNLRLAKADKEKNCMCERVYPVINADGSIAVCHLYSNGLLAADCLIDDYHTLSQKRRFNSFCGTCQAQGLHRFDVSLLNATHK